MPEIADALRLDAHARVTFAELLECSGWTEAELRELIDCGALAPLDPQGPQWTFDGACVVVVRTARRLRADFELDPQAVALALELLERIRALELQVQDLRAQLPRRFP